MPLLKNSVLLLSLAVLCATTAQAAPVVPTLDQSPFPSDSDLEAMTGPLPERWTRSSFFTPEHRASQEKSWQEYKVATRKFSEKVVSNRCTSILESTLDHLENVRDFVQERLLDEESNELLHPILWPLSGVLTMAEDYYITIDLTDEVIEEEKRKEKEEEEEKERRAPAPSPSSFSYNRHETLSSSSVTEQEKSWEKEIRHIDWDTKQRIEQWTEDSHPQFVLMYRLRQLEKHLAALPYVLKFAPEPVRQELGETGFLRETETLRKDVRSLMTCQGVTHVTVAQLKEDLPPVGSDGEVDRSAASRVVNTFYNRIHMRLVMMATYSEGCMFYRTLFAGGSSCEPKNTTQVEDRAPVRSSEEGNQQLKDQVPEDSSLFSAPEVKSVWTWEAALRLKKGTEGVYPKRNPELAALMFPEL